MHIPVRTVNKCLWYANFSEMLLHCLQLLAPEEATKRQAFYAERGIAWVARPKHGSNGYDRRGRFKKVCLVLRSLNFECHHHVVWGSEFLIGVLWFAVTYRCLVTHDGICENRRFCGL